ncbi:calcium-binding protein [Streptomyces sp. M2CJ-2]|uniref:calcium-binding protein n=1 Tax=Streptomyces sp. M2CJ-2 TaxID=2803948 RepID=UPI0019293841|nr:calcium-binding protein [Streptomyces sp. M2CJ-2]MBL3667487.1 calcium-binding protein [Streptomyces sp. M2CJ-2]
MRIRAAAVAAVSGALALSALAAPAAQADGGWGDTTITKVVVDGDNKVSVGTSSPKTIKVSVTAKDNSGIKGAEEFMLMGPGYGFASTSKPVCKASSSTTSTCTASVLVDPKVDYLSNANAGTWYVEAWIDANDDDYLWKEKAGSFKFQRASKLTVNASPEPVKKGATITVTGKLTRANWETLRYAGYTNQSVKLQFRKKNSSTYTTIKTIKTNSKGDLKTTVKASVDGYYRYNFEGTSTTPAVKAAGDFVDVK